MQRSSHFNVLHFPDNVAKRCSKEALKGHRQSWPFLCSSIKAVVSFRADSRLQLLSIFNTLPSVELAIQPCALKITESCMLLMLKAVKANVWSWTYNQEPLFFQLTKCSELMLGLSWFLGPPPSQKIMNVTSSWLAVVDCNQPLTHHKFSTVAFKAFEG